MKLNYKKTRVNVAYILDDTYFIILNDLITIYLIILITL